MATKTKTSQSTKPKKIQGGLKTIKKLNWKSALLVILLVSVVGGFFVYKSFAATQSARIVNLSQFPTLRKGSTGSTVVSLRDHLSYAVSRSHGKYGSSQKFDADLDTAVRNFQKFFGLTVDGIVGPKTWTGILYVESEAGRQGRNYFTAPDVQLRYAYGTYLLTATCPSSDSTLLVRGTGSAYYGNPGGHCTKAGQVLNVSAAVAQLPRKGIVGEVQWNKGNGSNYSLPAYIYFP